MTSRRKFLTHTCSLGVAAATASTTVLSLGFARQAAAQSLADYRALVCILLAGGNDSFNMVVPNDFDQYSEYLAIRSDLALEQSVLLPLQGTTSKRSKLRVAPGYARGAVAFRKRRRSSDRQCRHPDRTGRRNGNRLRNGEAAARALFTRRPDRTVADCITGRARCRRLGWPRRRSDAEREPRQWHFHEHIALRYKCIPERKDGHRIQHHSRRGRREWDQCV